MNTNPLEDPSHHSPPQTAPLVGPYAPAPSIGETFSAPPVSPAGQQPLPAHTIPPPSDSPSPVGLLAAGAGLILLCASILIPRVSISYEDIDEYGYFGGPTVGTGEVFSVGASSMLLTVALLAAVGLSAHRAPGFRWPARLGAVALAAITAAFAYHPITVMQQVVQVYEDVSGNTEYAADVTPEITVSADSGLYLAVLGVALLATSTFLMRPERRPQIYQPMPPAPAAGPGTAPGITVTPG